MHHGAVTGAPPGNRSKLYAINTGYQLVCYMVMGAMLGAWR
jgi:hypothetical protein